MREDSLTLVLVMAVYNEEEIIEEVINKWVIILEELRIRYALHIYNDGSRDRTGQLLYKLAQCNRGVFVHNQENCGHGPTILKGYKNNTIAEWIFQADSDNEIEAAAFIQIWQKRDKYDFLIGKRINYSKFKPIRRIISILSRVTVGLLYGNGVYDTNSPFRLMRTSCFRSFLDIIPSNTVSPNLIISGIAARKRMRIFEQEVGYHFRKTGQVSIKHFKLFQVAVKSFLQTIMFSLRFRKYLRGN